MALVDYSDSDSDADTPLPAPKTKPAKPAFQKVVDRSVPGKIRVDLPSIKAENEEQDAGERPVKRARTGGAFSGFNSLLPPPKRKAQSTLKPGISLKTSGEAAFSRDTSRLDAGDDAGDGGIRGSQDSEPTTVAQLPPPAEPKLVGKPTRFVPLSVANKKKKSLKKTLPISVQEKSTKDNDGSVSTVARQTAVEPATKAAPEANPRKSLFMAAQEEEEEPSAPEEPSDTYEPLLEKKQISEVHTSATPEPLLPISATDSNSLEAVASDLNLTAAQRRQLFGRKGRDTNIAHFNMEAEYAANEELRKAGEIVQHRAVKAIAPGKHSLQQLVNNAKSQKDAIEDAWAEGRKNRAEGGSRYGWA